MLMALGLDRKRIDASEAQKVQFFCQKKNPPNNLGELSGDNDYATWHHH